MHATDSNNETKFDAHNSFCSKENCLYTFTHIDAYTRGKKEGGIFDNSHLEKIKIIFSYN